MIFVFENDSCFKVIYKCLKISNYYYVIGIYRIIVFFVVILKWLIGFINSSLIMFKDGLIYCELRLLVWRMKLD